MADEKIVVNGKILQYGVLSSDEGYQVYTYPGYDCRRNGFQCYGNS